IDDAVDVLGGGPDSIAVGNAPVDKAVARVPVQVAQVRQVAGVGQAVEVDDGDLRVLLQQIADEVAPDKTATARHQYRKHADTSRETCGRCQPGRTARPGAGNVPAGSYSKTVCAIRQHHLGTAFPARRLRPPSPVGRTNWPLAIPLRGPIM